MGRFDNKLFRCSALAKIWSANGELTQGNITYLRELFIEDVYGVRNEVTSKYFEKGKFTEEDGITLLGQTIHKGKLIRKNKERKFNDYICGECDVDILEWIYDNKAAYDLLTFGKAHLSTDYFLQLHGYMWLWGKTRSRLFYSLNNTPEHMIVDEERKLFYKGGFLTMESPDYLEACVELRALHNYDHMPLEQRFKLWDVEYDYEIIDKLIKKIDKCRKKLNQMYEEHEQHISYNKKLMGII